MLNDCTTKSHRYRPRAHITTATSRFTLCGRLVDKVLKDGTTFTPDIPRCTLCDRAADVAKRGEVEKLIDAGIHPDQASLDDYDPNPDD